MTEKNNEYKLQQSNSAQKILDLIKLHFDFQLLDDQEKLFLNNIQLFFYNNEFSNILANAYIKERDISWNLGSECNARFVKTLIHEIAHIICYEYFSDKMKHTLEFAIVSYCMLHKYNPDYTEFFCSYDIHEDKAYRYISINPAQFDDFIKSIQWETLKELTKKAEFLAVKIRNKQAFFTVEKWNLEYLEFINNKQQQEEQ